MLQTVEIFYTFECPYSYLAIDRLSQIEQKFDVRVLWQPFSAQATAKNMTGPMLPQDRTTYIKEDVTRLARSMGMPLVMREDWPEVSFDPEKSIRGAVVVSDLELVLEYNIKMFHRWWGEGLDPNDQSFFIQLCDDLDVDANEFSGRINTTDTRERVRGIYKRGRKLQVFDTPTIIIGEERFLGIDRIACAEQRLVEMGLEKGKAGR